MKKYGFRTFVMIFVSALFIMFDSALLAQDGGMPTETIKNAYRQILADADKNGDGKISMQECRAMSSARRWRRTASTGMPTATGLLQKRSMCSRSRRLGM